MAPYLKCLDWGSSFSITPPPTHFFNGPSTSLSQQSTETKGKAIQGTSHCKSMAWRERRGASGIWSDDAWKIPMASRTSKISAWRYHIPATTKGCCSSCRNRLRQDSNCGRASRTWQGKGNGDIYGLAIDCTARRAGQWKIMLVLLKIHLLYYPRWQHLRRSLGWPQQPLMGPMVDVLQK